MQYPHAGGSDFDDMLLMVNTQSNGEQSNMWYLDSGCSNHMSDNKSWFTKLDESIKKVIRFADGRHVTSDKFKLHVEKQSGCKLKKLRTDGGGEYTREFARFCNEEGIEHEFITPYKPQ